METGKFKVGDRVEWTSRGGKYVRVKQGKVVAIIPPGVFSTVLATNLGYTWGQYGDTLGLADSRDHESYLIEGPPRTGRTTPRVYCPLVKNLKLIEQKAEEKTEAKVEEVLITDPTPAPEGGFIV